MIFIGCLYECLIHEFDQLNAQNVITFCVNISGILVNLSSNSHTIHTNVYK